MHPTSNINSAEPPTSQPGPRKLKRYRSVQVNFRVSSKWLNIVNMLATLEGRSSSALMRELLTLGLAQYVNIYYRTPQSIRKQQLQSILNSQLPNAASEAKTKAAPKISNLDKKSVAAAVYEGQKPLAINDSLHSGLQDSLNVFKEVFGFPNDVLGVLICVCGAVVR